MPDANPRRRDILMGGALAALPAVTAMPPMTGQPSAILTARANHGTVGLISGGVDGTYIRIAADLASVLDDGENLRVLAMLGKGSIQNISDLIYLRGIDIAIVQSDALAFLTSQNWFPGVTTTVRYIAKLYDEEVHVLARADIASLGDCAGKKVNLDVRGSGTGVTGSLLFGKLGIAIEPTYYSQENALKLLRDGELAALVYVAGQPATLFSTLGTDSRLHFLTVPLDPALVDTYLPAQLASNSYPGLISGSGRVDTVAVGAVMAAFGWMSGSDRFRRVSNFVTALGEKLPQLQQAPHHPKWREVNLRAEVPGWTRFTLASRPKAGGSASVR